MEELYDSAYQNIDHSMTVLTEEDLNPAAYESISSKKPVIFSSPPPQKLNKAQLPKLKIHQENENVTES